MRVIKVETELIKGKDSIYHAKTVTFTYFHRYNEKYWLGINVFLTVNRK